MEKITHIKNTTEVVVKFNEVDSLGIVWHGHYLRYFEDGREAFGAEHGLGYLDVYAQNFVIPIVKIDCDYKRPLKYGDKFLVETIYWDTPAAKLIFSYTLKNSQTGEVVATGKSLQVFLTTNGDLSLNPPDFFIMWKKKVGLLK